MMMILGYCIDNDKIVDCKYGDYNNDDVDALHMRHYYKHDGLTVRIDDKDIFILTHRIIP